MTLTKTYVYSMSESARSQIMKNLSAPSAMFAHFMHRDAYKLLSRRNWVQRQRDDYMQRTFTQRHRIVLHLKNERR